jgi:hypothetical protein
MGFSFDDFLHGDVFSCVFSPPGQLKDNMPLQSPKFVLKSVAG